MDRVNGCAEVSAAGAREIVRGITDAAAGAGGCVSVAVVDSAGAPVVMERMDGALRFSAELALAKARTAAAFGRPTAEMERVMQDRPVFAQSFTQQGGWYLGRGGHPLLLDGRLVGGIGVSGDAAEVEDTLARDAAAAFARVATSQSPSDPGPTAGSNASSR